jgi:hypothetical protein
MKSKMLIAAFVAIASASTSVLSSNVALSATVEAARTECSVQRGSQDASSIPYSPSVLVTCVGEGVLSQDGSYCYQWHATNAEVQARGYGCGTWTGVTRHWLINGSTWYWVGGNDISRPLRAGFCPRDPDGCESWEVWDEIQQRCIPQNTPIIIPLTRSQAYTLTSKAEGVAFDHSGDGVAEQTAWTAADSKLAFLAIDRNGNGKIDNGTELFGNHTMPGQLNGFDALDALNRQMGGEEVGIIDSSQPIFSHLLLWEDANHNGVSEPQELQPAANLLSGIGLGLVPHNRRDGHGNLFMLRGFAHLRSQPGKNFPHSPADDRARRIVIYDVLFTQK